MNRAIWSCWKVDGLLFDWPSFPHSGSRRHLLTIPVVPVYHHGHVSTSSLLATWVSKRGKGRKATAIDETLTAQHKGIPNQFLFHISHITVFSPYTNTILFNSIPILLIVVFRMPEDSEFQSDTRYSRTGRLLNTYVLACAVILLLELPLS
jgi:hypothetical protein